MSTSTHQQGGTQGRESSASVVVCPIRFTDDVDAMRDFLVLLGLQPRIAAQRGGWVDLVAGAGMVALHSAAGSTTGARPGETTLCFVAEDLDGLATRLESAGVADVAVIDEAFGRQLQCTDPLGAPLAVNDTQEDLYGYTRSEGEPDRRLRVMPIRFTAPTGPYADFLTALGLPRRGEPDDAFTVHSGPGECGQVGLHRESDDAPTARGSAVVDLSFETSERLDDVAARLEQAGFSPSITREDWGAYLVVTDPDGCRIEVHQQAS